MKSVGWTSSRTGFQTLSKGQISTGRSWKKHLDFRRVPGLGSFKPQCGVWSVANLQSQTTTSLIDANAENQLLGTEAGLPDVPQEEALFSFSPLLRLFCPLCLSNRWGQCDIVWVCNEEGNFIWNDFKICRLCFHNERAHFIYKWNFNFFSFSLLYSVII